MQDLTPGGPDRGEGFGNARFARTLFEQALNTQALRLAGVQGAELASLERGFRCQVLQCHIRPCPRVCARACAALQDLTPSGPERGEGFGNARFARTLFEQALNTQALRLAGVQGAELASLERDELITLRAEDLLAAARGIGEEPAEPARRSFWRSRAR